jgi:hypothetical protein
MTITSASEMSPLASPSHYLLPSWLARGYSGSLRNSANFLVVIFGHFVHKWTFENTNDSTFNVILYSCMWWLFMCWIPSFVFAHLDSLVYHRQVDELASSHLQWLWHTKLQNTHTFLKRTSYSFWNMFRYAAINELTTCVLFGILFVHLDVAAPAQRPLNSLSALPDLLVTIICVILTAVAYDVVFFIGHFAMHRIPGAYRSTHKQHHLTFADMAISHHWMGPIDFLLETVLPCCLPVILFGLHPAGWFGFIGMGAFNGVVVHSGYDLPYMPDPRPHLAHHRNGAVNFSLGLLDSCFGTTDDGELDHSK